MRLDFYEANILIQTIGDLEKYKKPVNKNTLVELLHELQQNTDKKCFLVVQSIRSLSAKLETLSDKSIDKIRADVNNNKIVATARYILPRL